MSMWRISGRCSRKYSLEIYRRRKRERRKKAAKVRKRRTGLKRVVSGAETNPGPTRDEPPQQKDRYEEIYEAICKRLDALEDQKKKGGRESFVERARRMQGDPTEDEEEFAWLDEEEEEEDGNDEDSNEDRKTRGKKKMRKKGKYRRRDSSSEESESEEESSRRRKDRKSHRRKSERKKRKKRNKRRGRRDDSDSSSSESDSDSSSTETSSEEERSRRKSKSKKNRRKVMLKRFWKQKDKSGYYFSVPIVSRIAEEKLAFILSRSVTVSDYIRTTKFVNERNRHESTVLAETIDLLLTEFGQKRKGVRWTPWRCWSDVSLRWKWRKRLASGR